MTGMKFTVMPVAPISRELFVFPAKSLKIFQLLN
jgi:hypothetical protein